MGAMEFLLDAATRRTMLESSSNGLLALRVLAIAALVLALARQSCGTLVGKANGAKRYLIDN